MILSGELGVEPAKKDEILSQIQKETMPPALLAEILINPPFRRRFRVDAEEAFRVTEVYEVIGFFLSCPTEPKPSLNKAIYFMKKGDFQLGHRRPLWKSPGYDTSYRHRSACRSMLTPSAPEATARTEAAFFFGHMSMMGGCSMSLRLGPALTASMR
jgi:hypothetical protein